MVHNKYQDIKETLTPPALPHMRSKIPGILSLVISVLTVVLFVYNVLYPTENIGHLALSICSILIGGMAGSIIGIVGLLSQKGNLRVAPAIGAAMSMFIILYSIPWIISYINSFNYPEFIPPMLSEASPGPDYVIPSSNDVSTQSDYNQIYHSWIFRNTLDAYKASCEKEYTYNKDVESFLINMCRYKSGLDTIITASELEEDAADLIEKGHNHPLIHLWYGWILYEQKRYNDSWQHADKAMMVMVEKKYSLVLQFFGAWTVLEAKSYAGKITSGEIRRITDYCNWSLCSSISNGEFLGREVQIAYRIIDYKIDKDEIDNFYSCLQQKNEINPWLARMVEGLVEIEKAWDSRGGGWAKDVTDEGWKGFRKHLENARLALTEAWDLHPDYPESSGEMVFVAMAGGGLPGENETFWFNRSVSSQMDYAPAYYNMLHALQPKWGGSEGKLIEFGDVCLATNRFDTDVPLFYLRALRKAASLKTHNQWRSIFRRSEVNTNTDKLFEGLLNEPSRKSERSRILTQKAIVKLWSGDYREAEVLMNDAGKDIKLNDGFTLLCLSWSCRDREEIAIEIELYNGTFSDQFEQAEKTLVSGNVSQAIPMYIEILEHSKENTTARDYLLRRIALMKLDLAAEYAYKSYSALYFAADENNMEVAEFLIENGFDVNTGNADFGATALHTAAENNYVPMLKFLLEKGADINLTNSNNDSVLITAIENDSIETADVLIDSGIDVSISNKQGLTALSKASSYGYYDLVKRLIESGANLNSQNCSSWTPLTLAIKNKHHDLARLLIIKGADVNLSGPNGWSPLMLAVFYESQDIVNLLIDSGAEINHQTKEGNTPLHYAIHKSNSDIARYLIQKGANGDVPNIEGSSSVTYSVKKQMPEVLKLLIDKGADINHITLDNRSNTHITAENGNYQIMKILVDNNADISKPMPNGKTPLIIARENNHKAIIDLLITTELDRSSNETAK